MPVYQGFWKRAEMQGQGISFLIAIRLGMRRVLPDMPKGTLDDVVERVNAHFRAKGEHTFQKIKRLFGLQKKRLLGMLRNR
jgi:hypothetical protein